MKKNLKILVVDDNFENRNLLKAILEKDYIVVCAPDGKEAILILNGDRYDLVITDFHMPRADGNEVMKFVKERFPKTKIILTTACSETAAQDALADIVFQKPYSIKEIEKAVRELINSDDETNNTSVFCGMEWDK